jgi:hypothetical protein
MMGHQRTFMALSVWAGSDQQAGKGCGLAESPAMAAIALLSLAGRNRAQDEEKGVWVVKGSAGTQWRLQVMSGLLRITAASRTAFKYKDNREL